MVANIEKIATIANIIILISKRSIYLLFKWELNAKDINFYSSHCVVVDNKVNLVERNQDKRTSTRSILVAHTGSTCKINAFMYHTLRGTI